MTKTTKHTPLKETLAAIPTVGKIGLGVVATGAVIAGGVAIANGGLNPHDTSDTAKETKTSDVEGKTIAGQIEGNKKSEDKTVEKTTQAKKDEVASDTTATATDTQTTAPKTVTVQPGDTLSGIAAQNNVTVPHLQELNPGIKDINVITPGQAIVITNKPTQVNIEKHIDESGKEIKPSAEYKLISTSKADVKESTDASGHKTITTTVIKTYHKIVVKTVNKVVHVDESSKTIAPSVDYKLIETSAPAETSLISENGDVTVTSTVTKTYHKIVTTNVDKVAHIDEAGTEITPGADYKLLSTSKAVKTSSTADNGDVTVTSTVTKTYHKIVTTNVDKVVNIDEAGKTITPSADYKLLSTSNAVKTSSTADNGDVTNTSTVTKTYHKIVTTNVDKVVHVDEAGKAITPSADYKLLSTSNAVKTSATADNGDVTNTSTVTKTYHKIVTTNVDKVVNIDEAGKTITPSADYKLLSTSNAVKTSATADNGDVTNTSTVTKTYHKIVTTNVDKVVHVDEAGKTITPDDTYLLISTSSAAKTSVTAENGDVTVTSTVTKTYYKIKTPSEDTPTLVDVEKHIDEDGKEITPSSDYKLVSTSKPVITESSVDSHTTVTSTVTKTYHKIVTTNVDKVVNVDEAGKTITPNDDYKLLSTSKPVKTSSTADNGDVTVTSTVTKTYHKIVTTNVDKVVNVDEAGKTITPSADYKLLSTSKAVKTSSTADNGDVTVTSTVTKTYHKIVTTNVDKVVNVDEAGKTITPSADYKLLSTSNAVKTSSTADNGDVTVTSTVTKTYHKIVTTNVDKVVNVDEAGKTITPSADYKLLSTSKPVKTSSTADNGDVTNTSTVTKTYHKIVTTNVDKVVNIDEAGKEITPSADYKLISTSNAVKTSSTADNGDVTVTSTVTKTYHKIVTTNVDKVVHVDEAGKTITPDDTYLLISTSSAAKTSVTAENGDVTVTSTVTKTYHKIKTPSEDTPTLVDVEKHIDEDGKEITPSSDYKLVSTSKPVITESSVDSHTTVTSTVTKTYHKIVTTNVDKVVNVDEAGKTITPSADYKLLSTSNAVKTSSTADNGDVTVTSTVTKTYHKIVTTNVDKVVNVDEAGKTITPSADYKLLSTSKPVKTSATADNGDVTNTSTVTKTYHKIVTTNVDKVVNIDEAGKTITPNDDYKLISTSNAVKTSSTADNGDVTVTSTVTKTYHKIVTTNVDKVVNVDEAGKTITPSADYKLLSTSKPVKTSATADNGDVTNTSTVTKTYHKIVTTNVDKVVNIDEAGKTITPSADYKLLSTSKPVKTSSTADNGDVTVTSTVTKTYRKINKTVVNKVVNVDESGKAITPDASYKLISTSKPVETSVTATNGDVTTTSTVTKTYHKITTTTVNKTLNVDQSGKDLGSNVDTTKYTKSSTSQPTESRATAANGDVTITLTTTIVWKPNAAAEALDPTFEASLITETQGFAEDYNENHILSDSDVADFRAEIHNMINAHYKTNEIKNQSIEAFDTYLTNFVTNYNAEGEKDQNSGNPYKTVEAFTAVVTQKLNVAVANYHDYLVNKYSAKLNTWNGNNNMPTTIGSSLFDDGQAIKQSQSMANRDTQDHGNLPFGAGGQNVFCGRSYLDFSTISTVGFSDQDADDVVQYIIGTYAKEEQNLDVFLSMTPAEAEALDKNDPRLIWGGMTGHVTGFMAGTKFDNKIVFRADNGKFYQTTNYLNK